MKSINHNNLIFSSLIKYNPLSYFPQGGKDGFSAIPKLTPSPLGEGWEGGILGMKRTLVFNFKVPADFEGVRLCG